MFLNEVMEETRKICNSENWPIWATPENLPFFEDEIYPLFSYSYGSKVPKWKCAHNLLCKKYKNCLKLIKIADLQPPDWIQRKKNTLYNLMISGGLSQRPTPYTIFIFTATTNLGLTWDFWFLANKRIYIWCREPKVFLGLNTGNKPVFFIWVNGNHFCL